MEHNEVKKLSSKNKFDMPLRADELIRKRNEKIYHRYKELYDINYLRHERVLELLVDEFFILPRTLERIVSAEKGKSVQLQSKENHV